MNLITQTYDADKWQLVPKVATEVMLFEAMCWTAVNQSAYAELLAAAPQPELISAANIDALIKHAVEKHLEEMKRDAVNRFLGWTLPRDFAPDNYIEFNKNRMPNGLHLWPVGTNLFTAEQTKAMFDYCLQPLPQAPTAEGATAPEVE